MQIKIDQWIAQYKNLKPQCERIINRKIADTTWYSWEKIAGANYPQGKPKSDRCYKPEQWQMLLCLALFRKQWPGKKIDYIGIRFYHAANEYKIQEVLDEICNPKPQKTHEPVTVEKIPLAEVKINCDRIMNSAIATDCWSRWKQHIGIPKYQNYCDKSQAMLLTYIAYWRQERLNKNKKLPPVQKLLFLMQMSFSKFPSLESVVSSKQISHWQQYGCPGSELHRYLTVKGYPVTESTLYRWGEFRRKKHYSAIELLHWEKIARDKRYGT